MISCLYEGDIRHQRWLHASHGFRYGLYMAYLDLDELPALAAGGYGLGRRRCGPAVFLRRDHVGDPRQPLADAVRELVQANTGWRPAGPIRLLTLLRNWGYYFCPLCLYYCFDPQGTGVEAVVGEVSNTPWRERHWYVLWQGNRVDPAQRLRFRHPKQFHVSPFMDMDMEYQWELSVPGPDVRVAIVNWRGPQRLFAASMVLHRRELTRTSMLRTLAHHPWMTGKAIVAIHWQALHLWRKRCPFHDHPGRQAGQELRQP